MDGDVVAFPPHFAVKAEPEKVHFVRFAYATLLLVDLKPHALLQEPTDRCHDALAGPFAAHEDVRVVGVADETVASPGQFTIQLVKHDVGKHWRKRAALRCAFLDGNPRSVRHHHRSCQHPAYQGDYPLVRPALCDPGQQALMMNVVKKFGQVKINHRLITSLKVSFCFGNGGVGTAVGAEPVTAGVEGWLEDRLQYLEDRLLNHPVHHVWDTETPLPASGLRKPDPANVAGPVASRQQVATQGGDDRRRLRFRHFHRLAVHSWCSLVAYHFQQRRRQIGFGRHVFEQPTGVGNAGAGASRLLASRFKQQEASPVGCVRWLALPAPRRAVGERDGQLSWSRLFQSIPSLAPLAFTNFVATMKRSDFCVDIVPSSLPPSGLPLARTPADLPG